MQQIFEEGEGDKNISQPFYLAMAAGCYDNLGNEDKAVDTAHKAISIDAEFAQAWIVRYPCLIILPL